ncbi:hypothetical protein GCM10009865_00020 [Aeromicrobium ponti]|uniref:Uncharacterized protein n=1 Tax=Cytobacillus oceanisediminis TaxID=665099 RepID=A0A562J9X3_9BACI|nr:hypothetical protein [Cytobacillus oceanisediminis]TWH80012.1 hypothetical protein IQ19_04724 [Cytobacillus oceanisediminis]
MDANFNDFAKVLESALDKGQSESQITIHELVDDIKNQLEPLINKKEIG